MLLTLLKIAGVALLALKETLADAHWKTTSPNKCLQAIEACTQSPPPSPSSFFAWLFRGAQQGATPACPSPVCGHLRSPSDGKTFLSRLSPQCQAVMKKYRHADDGADLFGWLESEPERHPPQFCPVGNYQFSPSNVVIVEAPDMHGFGMCTIPKSGCSRVRKLLNAMVNHPQLWQETADGEESLRRAHQTPYPTLWHFKNLTGVNADVYPTFILGRNPYIRVLSGFLDKMRTNSFLNINPGYIWQGIPVVFHEFVKRLFAYKADNIDLHFGHQHSGCGAGFKFEYYLRIEDQALWFPCWEQGLNISRYTSSGWQQRAKGRVYLGDIKIQDLSAGSYLSDAPTSLRTSDNPEVNRKRDHMDSQCWWTPPGVRSCREFYETTHPGWDGRDLEEAGNYPAIPFDNKIRLEEVQVRDFHETGAAEKWKMFYTQEIADMVYDLYKADFEAFGYHRATDLSPEDRVSF